ncbi:outer membrane protein assembly factor BamE [Caldimonas tepidiphila]|uniref:outer membrane protein assembly factor BamE n=1 Tax=Caldimonas tepidiphila TaxID=2315841 RepID=UPI000E5A8AFF|nr:outer membrane protein assembly factor BamE [Caldimonas tepidiphila]
MSITKRAGLLPAALALPILLGACGSLQPSDRLLGVLTPYRIEIVQGNVVTQEMAAAVQPGMSRAQVREVLGSPLLTSIFHENRWDYVFTIRRQGAQPQERRVTAFFDGERLAKLEAGELPGEREFVDSIDTRRNKAGGKPPSLELSEDQLRRLPAAARPETAPALPATPPRDYPPLETESR